MKSFTAFTLGAAMVGGFYLAATSYARPAHPTIHLEPITHPAFDPNAIARNIELHQQRVKEDPKGAIGWGMLADAYLAESREFDRDVAAWKAEAAARKSLSLRTAGNDRARGSLVSSLLEQHRFQDAIHALDTFGTKKGRMRADVLIELGRYDEAKRLIAGLRPDDPSTYAAKARIALIERDPDLAIRNLLHARELVAGNPGFGETTLAWYDVKLGDAYVQAHINDQARTRYDMAVREHPRSYKAHLALARLNLEEKRWTAAIEEGRATLGIANSLDARAVIGDAYAGMGQSKDAETWYASCEKQFRDEVATFDRLGKGGPLHVRPIDRQFATFAANHHLYQKEALLAAKRDLANRPDPHAVEVLTNLQKEATQ